MIPRPKQPSLEEIKEFQKLKAILSKKELKKEYKKEYNEEHRKKLNEQGRKRYSKIKEREDKRRLKNRHNLTLEQLDKIIIQQNHQCAICSKSLMEIKRHIDHDHKTGKIRGILCNKCNLGLGLFNDNPKLFLKAIVYLEK